MSSLPFPTWFRWKHLLKKLISLRSSLFPIDLLRKLLIPNGWLFYLRFIFTIAKRPLEDLALEYGWLLIEIYKSVGETILK